jgi:hypothetical protein
LPSQASETAVAQQLARNPHLKFAELDRRVPLVLAVNDPYIGSQWHTPKISAPAAWDVTQGNGVVIAILDTGVDGSHPDLSSRMVSGWNFYDNNSNTSDVYGHGTATAGTAAATTNNGTGVAGVAGQARIMPIRISDTSGYGYYSMIAQGITYAADNGARVASISYAALPSSASVQSAAQYMKSKGGLVVVSAGNYGRDEGFAQTTNMIPVSATDGNDQITSWSSFGAFVAMSAPGAGIWTTARGGGYSAVNGTSFSAPITAGTVALIMAANSGLSGAQAEQVLFSTATDLGATGRDNYYGYGRVNADAAVRAAINATTSPGDTTAPTASITAPLGGSIVSGLVAVNVNASDNVGVTKVELRVNGSVYATDTSSPFAFSWDSTRVANGTVNLQAVAYDAAGNAGASATTAVTVSNVTPTPADTTPPTVAIVSPSNGGTVSGTVTISASATDNIGVARVEFWVNNVLTATDTSAPYSFGWNTRKLSGSQTIVAKAFDAAGNSATSSRFSGPRETAGSLQERPADAGRSLVCTSTNVCSASRVSASTSYSAKWVRCSAHGLGSQSATSVSSQRGTWVGAAITSRPAASNCVVARRTSNPCMTNTMRRLPSAASSLAVFAAFSRVLRARSSAQRTGAPNSRSSASRIRSASVRTPGSGAPPVTRTGSPVCRARRAP